MKAILCALLLASCISSKPVFPTNTDYERAALARYQSGQINWEQYQDVLKHESDNTP